MTKMTKEQLFESLKSCMLTFRDKREEFLTNKGLYKAWQRELHTIQKKIKELSKDDMLWLMDKHAEFNKKEMQPYIDNFLKNFSQ